MMDAAVVFHPESPAQRGRCCEIGSPGGVDLAEFVFVTFMKNGGEKDLPKNNVTCRLQRSSLIVLAKFMNKSG